METERSLVKSTNEMRLPKFVENAYESIDKMNQFAEILLQSKLLPVHFYEKGHDGKPDYTRGKTPAVVAVLIQGHQLQLPPLTAVQHIVPVNGLLSLKGDMAKSLIFNSGKLKPNSWKEEETGSIEGNDFAVKITATRADNGVTISRSFSVAQAKRAGLWVTEQQVGGQDGWRYKQSAWYKFPARMIYYRGLGFIARDLFSDVLMGVYTTEEAMDMPKETTEIIETPDGNKITIPDKEHATKRSEKLTARVADKIQPDKFSPVKTEEQVQEAQVVDEQQSGQPEQEESPFIPSRDSTEYMNGVKIIRGEDGQILNRDEVNAGDGPGDVPPPKDGTWTLKEMEGMDTKILLDKVNADTDMMEAMEMIEGKNTNKKLREIIFAWQEGNLAEHVASNMPKEEERPQQSAEEGHSDGLFNDPEMQPNKNFDKEKASQDNDPVLKPREKTNKVTAVNKYGIEISPVEEGMTREFSETKKMFNQFLILNPKIDNNRYIELAAKIHLLDKYPDREVFIKKASIEEINLLINNN